MCALWVRTMGYGLTDVASEMKLLTVLTLVPLGGIK